MSQQQPSSQPLAASSSTADTDSNASVEVEGVEKSEWSKRVRKPFIIASLLGSSIAFLNSIISHQGQYLIKSTVFSGIVFGMTAFSYYGTREYLNLRWRRHEMIETQTMSAAVGGFVAGAAYRTLFMPFLDIEHAVEETFSSSSASTTAADASAASKRKVQPTEQDKQALIRAIRRVSIRSLIGFGLLGAGIGAATTQLRQWYIVWKFQQLRLSQQLDELSATDDKRKLDIAQEERQQMQQYSYVQRKWIQLLSFLLDRITLLPDWLKYNSDIEAIRRHRKEMDIIYSELEKVQRQMDEFDRSRGGSQEKQQPASKQE